LSEPSINQNSNSRELAATQISEDLDYSKEDRDIAFAVEVLESAFLSERQMASALTTWTLYGSTTLAEQLVKTGFLSEENRMRLNRIHSAD
jgi:eukaryotic-like serine/threonine-protein kinase